MARHHLAEPGADVAAVTAAVVALHSTDPASVHLSAAARLHAPTVAAVERALYDDRLIVRMLGMRRTVFVVPRDLVPVIQSACTNAIARRQRDLLVQLVEQAGIAEDGAAWVKEALESARRAIAARGGGFAGDIVADVPMLSARILMAAGKPYESYQGVSSRVLAVLAAEGEIVRGRPRGSWVSTQYRWEPMGSWVGELADIPVAKGQAELAARWLAAYGPGTAADLKWWTGWTMGEARRALAAVAAVEVRLENGVAAYLLPDDVEAVAPAPAPAAALLPALDPSPMGWPVRGWFLGDHGPALFDRSGNIGPTVWWDGRIVGGWAQNKAGAVSLRLLEDIGHEGAAAVATAAARTEEFIGGQRVTPRFRTPLERELSG